MRGAPAGSRSLLVGGRGRGADDAAKSQMGGGSVYRLRVARGGTVAAAVVRRAEVRAALDHLAWDAALRIAGVVTGILPAAAGVCRGAAGVDRLIDVARL